MGVSITVERKRAIQALIMDLHIAAQCMSSVEAAMKADFKTREFREMILKAGEFKRFSEELTLTLKKHWRKQANETLRHMQAQSKDGQD